MYSSGNIDVRNWVNLFESRSIFSQLTSRTTVFLSVFAATKVVHRYPGNLNQCCKIHCLPLDSGSYWALLDFRTEREFWNWSESRADSIQPSVIDAEYTFLKWGSVRVVGSEMRLKGVKVKVMLKLRIQILQDVTSCRWECISWRFESS